MHEAGEPNAVVDFLDAESLAGQHGRDVDPLAIQAAANSGVTEFILAYDGMPSCAVSIMEFREGRVASETQYFADRF